MTTTHQSGKREALREQLRALIADLEPGAPLPTERELSRRYGVARMTLRQALADLTGEGLLRSTQGRGTFVQAAPLELRLKLGSFAQEVRRLSLAPSTRTLECVVDEDPPQAVRAHLRLRSNQHPARIVRLRLGDEEVLAMERTWLTKRVAAPLLRGTTSNSLHEFLDSRGVLPDGGEESVSARMPSAQEAELLGISVGSPVLRLVRTSTHAGAPVEYSESILAAHRTVLWFPLTPGEDGKLTRSQERPA